MIGHGTKHTPFSQHNPFGYYVDSYIRKFTQSRLLPLAFAHNGYQLSTCSYNAVLGLFVYEGIVIIIVREISRRTQKPGRIGLQYRLSLLRTLSGPLQGNRSNGAVCALKTLFNWCSNTRTGARQRYGFWRTIYVHVHVGRNYQGP